MKIRNVAILLLAAMLLSCFSIIACNSQTAEPTDKATEALTDKPTEKPTEEPAKPTEKPEEDPKDDDKEEPKEDPKDDEKEDPKDDEKDETLEDPKDDEKDERIAALLELRHELRADENGNFKVVVLSDIQGSDNQIPIPQNVLDNIKTIVDREKPDLIVFNGDNTNGLHSVEAQRKYISDMVGYIEQCKIPWAYVYGNHDHEGGLSKETQSEIYTEFEYCMFKSGDVSGEGNYVLPVLSHDGSKILYNVWCIDSGNYTSLENHDITLDNGDHSMGQYDYIKPDQVAWYRETSALLEEHNGAKIPAIMAFHIPLRETADAWSIRDKEGLEYSGIKRENIGCSSINSGMFSAVLERGDVKAIVNGHDHINDFVIKYHGVKLCYTSTVSTMHYHDADMLGARVFNFCGDANDPVQTYMSYIDESFGNANAEVISGTVIDFESKVDVLLDPWYAQLTPADYPSGIASGKGVGGSSAYYSSANAFQPTGHDNNVDIYFSLDQAGKLGNNKYLCFWMDLSGQEDQIEFRKACLGLIDVNNVCYTTDNEDGRTDLEFYYLADGTTQWKTLHNGDDGNFGADQNSPVRGYKGWFAMPINDMTKDGGRLNAESVIKSIYFFYSLKDSASAGDMFYIDNFGLYEDYKDIVA